MKRILLATDGSSHAEAATRFLAILAQQNELEVVVVTVVQRAPSYVTEQAIQREVAAAREAYAKVEKMLAGSCASLRHELREGHPGEMIVEVAKDCDAELVLVGARGRSRISCLLLGCTSDYVATHAKCSVLVVREERPIDTESRLRIAIGCDDSPFAKAALREMSEIIWRDGDEIHVVAILCCLYGFFGEIPLDSEVAAGSDSTERLQNTLTDSVSELREVTSTVKAHLIEHEHIGNGLVNFAKNSGCDLVVVGEKPQSTLARALLGSVSRFVLRHAPCSVWIVRKLSV
jgi:nucleotide-binding universal stress UspA family protein